MRQQQYWYEIIKQLKFRLFDPYIQKIIDQKQEWNQTGDHNSIYQSKRHLLQLMYQSQSSFSQHDTLQLKTEPKLQCLLQGKEQVVLSSNIFKYNSEGKCQQRILVVTNFAILNILKSENIIKTFMKKFMNFQNKYQIKRRILLANLYGITITPNRNSNIFLIHVNQEHDYHYRAENNKMLLIKVIADQYKKLTKNSLPFFFKEQSLIGNYFTTKSHLKEKKDIKPKDNPTFLNDDYFFDKKMDNQNYVCEYSHNNQIVQPRNFKVVNPKDIKTGQSYFIKKDQQNRSIHVSSLNKQKMLLNPYYTFYSDKKQVLFIPFMMGGNLKKLLSKKYPLSQSDLIFYLKQVLIFLLEFHQKGKIYCNITLENLLVKQNGYLMLNGLEKSIQQYNKDKLLFRVYGNPYYFPPQVIECRGYGPEIDVWKLGICAYILCKGFYPFHGNSTKELYYNIVHNSIEHENIPEFIKAMLGKQRQKRIKVRQLLDLQQFNNQEINQIQQQQLKAPFLPDPKIWQTSSTTIYKLEYDVQ